ncbi:hypothetical protein C8F01DRAFT_1193810 [Mycena amicta]|nr:hypothetical protein C8F01DRAFT_1193810 [Mycena amicta]
MGVSMAKIDAHLPTPIVDAEGIVMAVAARSPSDRWVQSAKSLSSKLIKAEERDAFANGPLEFGVHWNYPDGVSATYPAPTTRRLGKNAGGDMSGHPALKNAAAFGNELARKFFPGPHDLLSVRVDQLIQRARIPPFPGSVLPTCEIRLLGRDAAEPHTDWQVRHCDMMVGTVYGEWNSKTGGHLILPDDGKYLPLEVGDMFVIPSGSKPYAFIPVGDGEYQFLFCQYFHSSVYRWLKKGGKSDEQFERHLQRDLQRDRKKAAMVLRTWMDRHSGPGCRRQKMYE